MSRKVKHPNGEKEEHENTGIPVDNENLSETLNAGEEPEKMSANEAGTEITAEETAGKTEPARTGPGPEELLAQWQDKYLRLSADFDNYRKRSRRELDEVKNNAGEDLLVALLPVIDDFDRALQSVGSAQDLEAVKQGISLIHGKFREFLSQRGVKEIEALNQPFNLDFHEAIARIPAQQDELKGKNVDVISKGYLLKEKVIRYAKVVVGE